MELIPDSNEEGAKSTRYARKTLRPSYNEIFSFKLSPEAFPDTIFRVQVLSRDPMGKDDFLGERIIQLSDMDPAETWTSWFELQPEVSVHGTVPGEKMLLSYPEVICISCVNRNILIIVRDNYIWVMPPPTATAWRVIWMQ